ncbi:DUF6456 domain-containing protein [Shimia ponticola]|uniref:DUF6456 domain-containing protein n=1 Tax=Shimia ponticola TaxID=2582893 RepID=UPI002103AC1B|nr:DUF6456 domain-containing protein [Shimia ponticola]
MDYKRHDHMQINLPNWVPSAAQNYLIHTEAGQSIRALARETGVHASTILRQVRRLEQKRDDPLVDEGLRRLGRAHFAPVTRQANEDRADMKHSPIKLPEPPSEEAIAKEGRRILRRLCETGAVLAVAKEMDKAVVVRDTKDGGNTRTAVVDREIAAAMALKEWISCPEPSARIACYRITSVGRAALKRLLAEAENRAAKEAQGFAEAQAGFAGARQDWSVSEDEAPRQIRYNLAETPLASLSRRKDRDGKPFLSEDLVAAGEQLREDFELAQMAPQSTQNWERYVTSGRSDPLAVDGLRGPDAARERVQQALADLGPGLGDVVLRCCCFLEGMEAAEKRMGWSARSGKIVLRIALIRLKRHYEERHGRHGPMIG